MFNRLKMLVLSVFMLVAVSATSALAALAPADEALITAGISSSDASFYKLAGALMIVTWGSPYDTEPGSGASGQRWSNGHQPTPTRRMLDGPWINRLI